MKGFILETDARFRAAKEELINKGVEVVDNLDSIADLDFIVLGIKGVDDDGKLLCDHYFYEFSEEILLKLKDNCVIYTGVDCSYFKSRAQFGKFLYTALFDDDSLAQENAILTTEGLIAHLIISRNNPIYKTKVLVIGFGRCGYDIAMRLNDLNADVTVAMRNKTKMIQANARGIKTVLVKDMLLEDYDVIINTVPVRIISNYDLDKLSSDTMLLEIASYPYGFDIEYAKSIGLQASILPSLPGKYAYHYAGQMIADYIYERGNLDD